MTRIEQKDNGRKGRFIMYHDDEAAGEMMYVWVDDSKIIIDHTEVNRPTTGKGTEATGDEGVLLNLGNRLLSSK